MSDIKDDKLTALAEKKVIAVYGSLRKGYWNHNALLRECSYHGIETISGYVMRDNGCFPGVFYTGNDMDEITVELYADVPDDIQQRIDWMEEGAGYYSKEDITDSLELPVTLYVQPWSNVMYFEHEVPSGDWNEYEDNQRRTG